jgi:hypothetical protein
MVPFDREKPPVRAPLHDVGWEIRGSGQRGQELAIREQADLDRLAAARDGEPLEGRIERLAFVQGARHIAHEAQIGFAQRGEGFTAQLGGVRNGCRAPHRIERADAMAEFAAEAIGAGLLQQRGVKLLASIAFGLFSASAGVTFLLARIPGFVKKGRFPLCWLPRQTTPAALWGIGPADSP